MAKATVTGRLYSELAQQKRFHLPLLSRFQQQPTQPTEISVGWYKIHCCNAGMAHAQCGSLHGFNWRRWHSSLTDWQSNSELGYSPHARHGHNTSARGKVPLKGVICAAVHRLSTAAHGIPWYMLDLDFPPISRAVSCAAQIAVNAFTALYFGRTQHFDKPIISALFCGSIHAIAAPSFYVFGALFASSSPAFTTLLFLFFSFICTRYSATRPFAHGLPRANSPVPAPAGFR